METTTEYRSYIDSKELLADLAKGYVLYQAPLDWRPYSVKVKRYVVNFDKPEKSTVTFWTSETGTLTVSITEHFQRFKTRTQPSVIVFFWAKQQSEQECEQ